MLATFERLRGRCGLGLLVAAVAAGSAGLLAAPAVAAPTPAKWAITMEHHNPYGAQGGFDPFTEKEGDQGETFARESGWNTYKIKVTNVGQTTSAGTVKVVDHLPPGIVLGGKAEEQEASGTGWRGNAGEGRCTVVTLSEVECSTSQALKEGESFGTIELHVHVMPQAANPSVNRPSVKGGGAVPEETTLAVGGESEATVTEAVPFGIASFTTSVVDNLGSPFTQAGGHPFAASTEIVLNYTTNDDEGRLGAAGGPAKEIQAALPPGFIGNPQSTPQCPLESLSGDKCPANTAVGYTHVQLAGGRPGGAIVGGKAELFPAAPGKDTSSRVYNLQPTPGHVAELGFVVNNGLPFVLEAKVRSDGDYGVTVGDSAVGEKPLAVQLTVCDYGVPEKEVGPNFHCNTAPSARPFLTRETQCASAPPFTTATANPWDEPADYVSKGVYTGTHLVAGAPSATESFVTGCDLLNFHPEVEFKPSPTSEGGTSQADEPTGMTFDLKVPQSDDPAVNATPALKNLVMTLPPGMTVSPGAADGLQACSNAQFGLGTEFGPGSKHSEPAKPASCPLASQVGTVEVFTPLLSGAPKIEGPPAEGHLLACSPGAWSASAELSYQWLRNGVPIGLAAGREYAPVAADKGQALQCEVTATSKGGSSVAVSRDAVVLPEPSSLPPFPPSSIAPPSGAAAAGSTLTCASGAWTGSPTFTYEWLRGGVPIAGEKSSEYKLSPEDEGTAIQCQVTGNNAAGSVIAVSPAVVASPVPSPAPPLPGAPLQGQVFVGEPECSPCTNEDAQDGKLFRLFLQIQDPSAGVILKLHGINHADPGTGQLTTEFLQQPQQPFELLQLKLKGGPRAVLANPQSCGPATTSADLTPWSAPGLGGLTGEEPIAGTPNATPSSSFNVDWNGAGGACPQVLPFNPSFNAGTTGPTATTAGANTSFSLTFSRQDREQNLAGIQVRMPLGLVGKIAGIPQCGEAQANAGTCGPESQIGTTTTGAGPGPHPLFLGGKVYLTGPYKGAPFGLSIVVPAVAGPFNLGNEVVRSAIYIDPNTAAVTVTSDPLKQIRDGVPFRLREVNVEVNRPGFMLNPTNCSAQQVSATVSAAQGASAQVSSPFGLGSCGSLAFHPTLTASTQAETSKASGASLSVKVTSGPGQANIGKTTLILPRSLPSRLTTIQKACRAAVFNANPAACPEGSVVGTATAHSPLLNKPLTGPAYLVSHGNAAFPDLQFVLQGEGVTLVLDGQTNIKNGVTSSTFDTLPDAPVSTFETVLPEGPHSALAALGNLCTQSLIIPTTITGQNGAVIKQNTKIAVTGCLPAVAITAAKAMGNALLVTVKTGTTGTVWVSGYGLKTTKRNLTAGTHQIRVAFTKVGISRRRHHEKTSVRVKLIVGKQAITKTAAVRL